MSENFVAEFFSLLGIALLVISLRIAARVSLLGIRRLQLDDYLMLLAGVRDLFNQSLVNELTWDTCSASIPPRPLLLTMSWYIKALPLVA